MSTAAAKKKQPELGLLERIHAFRVEIDAFIQQKTMDVKNSRDGQGLVVADIRHMLTKGDTCICRAAARMLGDPDA